jgi:hypothetical protein
MEVAAQHAETVRFDLPVPPEFRIGGFGLISVFLSIHLLVFANLGLVRFRYLLSHQPATVFAPILVELLLSLGFIFPPRRILARLDLAHDHIRLVADLRARIATGESTEEVMVPPESKEILLCHRFAPRELDGYRIIVRAANGAEHWIGSRSEYTRIRLKKHDVERLTGALSSATGLPTRAIIRRQSASGAVEETPWAPTPAKNRGLILLAFACAGLPFAGGITMGWLSPNPAMVVAVGLGLWLCMMIVLIALARTDHKRFPALHALTTLVTFSATYATCFVVTAYLSHPH